LPVSLRAYPPEPATARRLPTAERGDQAPLRGGAALLLDRGGPGAAAEQPTHRRARPGGDGRGRMTAPPRVLRLGDDVNTDDIIPARRCTRADPDHLARWAFEHLLGEGRLAADWDEIEAGRNFGCGSSREHAPIA